MPSWKNTNLLKKLRNSYNGLRVGFGHEKDLTCGAVISAGIFLYSLYTHRDLLTSLFALSLSLLPISLELVNSAVEMLIDNHIGTLYREDVKRIKDMLSASVFISLFVGYGGALCVLFLWG